MIRREELYNNDEINECSVSVIVPAFNAANTLREAIASIQEQRLKVVSKIIIVDDYSTDNTVDVSKGLEKEYPGVVLLVRHSLNLGASNARNTGVEFAETPWIAFLDADDLWSNDKLLKQFECIRNSSRRIDVSTTDVLVKSMKTGQGYEFHNRFKKSKMNIVKQLAESDVNRLTPTILIRLELFRKISGFNACLRRMEDHEFLIRAITAGSFLHVSLPLTINRVYSDSTRTRDVNSLSSDFFKFEKSVEAVSANTVGCSSILSARVAVGNLISDIRKLNLSRIIMGIVKLNRVGWYPSSKVILYVLRNRMFKYIDNWKK